jgi:polysaccharide pyruvyl transferase WcaK-like protein
MKASKRLKRICFFGHFGMFNSGNESTLRAALEHARQRQPEAELTCICTRPEVVRETCGIEAVPISTATMESWQPRWRPAKWLRSMVVGVPSELWRWVTAFGALRGVDLLVVPGTGLLTDAYGLRGWAPYNVFKWSALARLRGGRVAFLSVGAGPVHSRRGKLLVKWALSLADYRSYRDATSRDWAGRCGLQANGDKVYPDLVFSLRPKSAAQPSARRRKVVGLGLMTYSPTYSTETNRDGVFEAYMQKLVRFAEWLLARDYDLKLLIGDISDEAIAQQFKVLLKNQCKQYGSERVMDAGVVSVETLFSELMETDVVVATRFHNVLVGLLLEKPVIAISFHHKCRELMSQMGLAEYCQEIAELDEQKLMDQFETLERDAEQVKGKLRSRVQECRAALDEQYDRVFKKMLPR